MESDHLTYVLTCDLPGKVRSLGHAGIEVIRPDHLFFTEVRHGLSSMIESMLPEGVALRVIDMAEFGAEIFRLAVQHKTSLDQAIIVSTCAEVSAERHGHTLEVNRLVGPDGSIIGLGPRPGFPPIEQQLDVLATVCRDKRVVLTEDGSFSGKTMKFIIEKCRRKQIKIEAVVLGFAFPEAKAEIRRVHDGTVLSFEEITTPLDWMPDHDFFPFVPNCGRVIGHQLNGYATPMYNHYGVSFAVPYLMGFCPMPEWTSLPAEGCLRLTNFCLTKTVELFEILEAKNGRSLSIGDLRGSVPSVSIPVDVGSHHFLCIGMETRVLDFLRDCRKMLD